MNCIFTGFNEKYWEEWGSSWIYSLREVAQYRGKVVVVDCGLSDNTKDKLKEKQAELISLERGGEPKIKTLEAIAKYSRKNKGNFVYWDADVFFESSIDDIFNQIREKIIVSENKNFGLVGAPYYQWAFIEDLINFARLAKRPETANEVLGSLIKNFDKFVEYVSNTWNFIELSQLSDSKIEVGGEKPKVIHPTGPLKYLLKKQNFLFHERGNKEFFEFLKPRKSSVKRKLLR